LFNATGEVPGGYLPSDEFDLTAKVSGMMGQMGWIGVSFKMTELFGSVNDDCKI